MSVMTVKIGPEINGRVQFETDFSMPRQRGRAIFGFAYSEADAKRRVIAYAGDDVEFAYQSDLGVRGAKGVSPTHLLGG